MHRRAFMAAGMISAATMANSGMNRVSLSGSPRRLFQIGHKFKFSLAAYSYRNLLTGDSPQLSLKDFVDDCARFGLEGTELTSYYFPDPLSDEFLHNLKAHAFRKGLDVSGTAIGNDFGHTDSVKRAEQIALTKTWIKRAEKLGAPVIRVFAGHPKKGSSPEQSHRLMVSALEECCEYGGQHGIHLALENHGGPTATAEGLLQFVRDVKSRWFGVNLDTGNFHSEDIYGDLEKVAPHAINVQVKVVTSGPDHRKQPTDFKRLAGILKSSHYRGYVVLEYEEKKEPRSESERYLEKLRSAFEK
ncbi:MAG: sugar phosphate isomerase/epimerase family protein [Planctomycetota bacterium]|nr:sugar phosphate isomerase/epimerase family protein [Planctomycetota bacterium]